MNVLLLSLVLSATSVKPEPVVVTEEGQSWSLLGGRTVGEGRGAVEGTVGWPGVSVGYLRGVAQQFDVGARASFIYAREGLVSALLPGLKVQGLVKLRLYSAGAVSVGATFEPGPFFNVQYGLTVWGFTLPIGLRVGVAASSALTLALSFDVPIWFQFGAAGGSNVGFMPGVGVEYFVKSDLLIFARARIGPTLRTYRLAELALDASVGVGWRL